MDKIEVNLYDLEKGTLVNLGEALTLNFISSIQAGLRSESALALMSAFLKVESSSDSQSQFTLEYELANLLDETMYFEFELVGLNSSGEVLFRHRDSAYLEGNEEGYMGTLCNEILDSKILDKITAWSLGLLSVDKDEI